MRRLAVEIAGAGIALSLAVLLVLGATGARRGAEAASRAGGPGRGGEDILADIPADQWLGSPAGLSGDGLRGRPVLLEFWTFLCYNCKNVEPWMKATYETYAPKGLQIIGVHTPEFDREKDVDNVRDYVRKNGIRYPVAIDNGFRVWRKYNATNAWPAFLVFDRQGKLIFRHAGENAVMGAEEAIRKALDEKPTGESARAGGAAGVRVAATGQRTSASEATLTVSFRPDPGYLLVKSPPNEVRLEPREGVNGPASPLLLGERFEGADSRDVSYYEGGAVLRVPLRLDASLGSGPLELSGRVVYHVCDATTKVCARHDQAFTARIEAS